ncbi:MAG: DUF2971 domain-containing protein [Proteobacteria bacterium]|nr:DUF2971 domain-containing protein [Desulfobacteraceae bacterium]MBU4012955.1 DUF2971 domain-containing protein [Pseudomonadota bacterium]MBU4066971.1 DUF2971 domain-containing protein [Pseudomonadota bacterium]MBU4100439.1 DUF2971 domain-containing protein [Pseudomonadota bacterium]MBU4127313.1 DUF2971 domain-containing protein [Pseudomonadota bacterium]
MQKRNYINLSEKEKIKYIYRTISFSRLVELFETKQNTLLSPSLWDDPFENFILKAAFDLNGEKVTFSIHEKCFGQCWSLKRESDAMWRIYSPDKSCVRIRTTVKNLAESLSANLKGHRISAFIGKVEYFTEKKLQVHSKKIASDIMESTGINFAKTLLVKRNSFEHENEVRLIYLGDKSEKSNKIFKYKVDPYHLITSVVIDPRAPDQLFNVYKHYLREKLGFNGLIVKSKLYKPPKELIYNLKI